MDNKEKRLPVNSVGKLIKEAREKQNLSIEELVWKINKPNITEKLIHDWEKGQKFPDLDNIYLLAGHLDLNPNDMLKKRITIQDESISEVNWANRRVGGKVFYFFYTIVRYAVKWLAGICIIVVVAYYKDFENKMGGDDPEQIQLIETVIDNAVEEYTIYDLRPKNASTENVNVSDNTLVNNTTSDNNQIKN